MSTTVSNSDRTTPVAGADPRFTITRHLAGYSYPQNGNVHNPTPRYRWLLKLDGRLVDSADRRRDLVDAARQGGVAAYEEKAPECSCHREGGSHELCCGHDGGRDPNCPIHGDGMQSPRYYAGMADLIDPEITG